MQTRKFLTISIILVMGITPILSSLSASSTSTPKPEKSSEQRWTIMAYSSADSADEWDGILYPFPSEVFSSDNIDVVLLENRKNESTKMWYVENNHSIRLLKDLGEISMGNYTTLRDFINYCKENFSSDRYILFFCGHGAGWRGACRDHGAGYRDDLTMDEMQKALIVAGGVDIVCFSGPCSMGSIESVYELRECTDVYIGSEVFCGYNYWRGTFNDLCILLNESSDISNAEVGNFIIESIKEKTPTNEDLLLPEKFISMFCAINTSGMKDLVDSIDDLIDNLTSNILCKFRIRILRHFTRSFITNLDGLRETVDVYDFAKKCSILFCFNSAIRTEAKNVMEKFDDAVIATYQSRFQLNAHGLSIYFPRFKALYDENYTSLDLDFINDTCWDEYLESYLNC